MGPVRGRTPCQTPCQTPDRTLLENYKKLHL